MTWISKTQTQTRASGLTLKSWQTSTWNSSMIFLLCLLKIHLTRTIGMHGPALLPIPLFR